MAERKRYYVGKCKRTGVMEMVYGYDSKMDDTRDTWVWLIGPFRTKRGARFMLEHGEFNPHCLCVADAERIAKT